MSGCERLEKALRECVKRVGSGPGSDRACGHLNRGLAQCLVAMACPEESEAVRSLCSSGGTALKRSQCQQAQLSLSVIRRKKLKVDGLLPLLENYHGSQSITMFPDPFVPTSLLKEV